MNPYGEGLNEDEQKLLDSHLGSDEVPAADAQEGAPVDNAAPAGDEQQQQQPVEPPAQQQAAEGDQGQTDDQKFAAWMEQHKDKSPEDIARLAFQQQQRAATAGYQHRQSQQQLEALQGRVTAATQRMQQVQASVAERRLAFSEKLNTDPDGAAQEIHDRMLSEEEQAAEDAVRVANVEAAFGLAAAAIPDFQKQAPDIFSFGGEMGYSQQELAGISDGRDLVVLSLARYAANLIKGGMMDARGTLLLEMPKAIDDTDPRLNPPAPPKTLSSAPARSAGGGKSVDQMASDMLSLSDEDFAKLPPKEIEALLAQLNV